MDEASNCFKPNPLAANFDHNNHKPVTLGAVFQGAMNRVPRQTTTSKGALVWEAGIEKKFMLNCQVNVSKSLVTTH